jgi:hypothetical protein
MTITYDLNLLFNNASNNNASKNEKNDLINRDKLLDKQILHKDKEYNILRYNKQAISYKANESNGDNEDHEDNRYNKQLGLYRSVIYSGEKIMAFSPPKSLYKGKFMAKYQAYECSAEEIIEGTMINLFYVQETGVWEIATKSTLDGCNTFYINDSDYTDIGNKKTFRQLFLEVCEQINFNYKELNTSYCYSFVFQHPENRIVVQFNEYRLYLISVYNINNTSYIVTQLEESEKLDLIKNTNIMIPHSYDFTSYDDIEAIILFMNDNYKNTGIMLHHTTTGARCKFRNPAYDFVRMLRGNQPKLKYRFFELRQKGQVSAYLRYFPEAYNEFTHYKKQLHSFTEELYENYIRCYIKKEKPLLEFEKKQYHTHMYNLHHLIYKENLKPKGKSITKQEVITYVNKLPPSVLMGSINYKI